MSVEHRDQTHIHKSLRISEKLMIIGSLLVGGACIGYCLFPVAVNYRKVLPIRTMFTFGLDVFKSPIYECFIIYQIIGTVCHTVIAMVFDMTYVGFLLCSAAILKNLNTEFKRHAFQKYRSSEEKHIHLIRHLKANIEIFDFLNVIRALFMGSNMVHFSYSYFTAGLTMFQISRQPIGSINFFSMISGCSSCVFGLVCYCEAGQKITNEMHSFWQNLYFSDWYEQPVKYRRSTIFALLTTQKNYFMLAGKLMTLSRETEKQILQAIFTYYTFLLQFNQ